VPAQNPVYKETCNSDEEGRSRDGPVLLLSQFEHLLARRVK